MKGVMHKSLRLVAGALFFLAVQQESLAGSATWSENPVGNDWNTAENWMPNTVPNGPSDTASFATSNLTEITISAVTEVSGLNFDPGASSFTITGEPGTACIISGEGISNASGEVQTFTCEVDGGFTSAFTFQNNASAGDQTVFFAMGGNAFFNDSSSAGSATFVVASTGIVQGHLFLFDNSTAAEATIQLSNFAIASFGDFSTAGSAVFTATDGGDVAFGTNSTAGNAVFTCSDGGGVEFTQFATADHGSFTANGASVSGDTACFVNLSDDTTAGDANFLINGGSASGRSWRGDDLLRAGLGRQRHSDRQRGIGRRARWNDYFHE